MAEVKKAAAKPVKEVAAKKEVPAAPKKATVAKAAPVKTEAKVAPAVKPAVEKKPEVKKAQAKKTLRVTLIHSTIGREKSQRLTVEALGLKKLNSSNDLVDNPAIRGMIFKVKHLVKVEEIK